MNNTNITISKVEETETQVKIKDEQNQSWTFFKLKKTGGPTVAYEQFGQYKVGDKVGVGFKTTPNPYGGVYRNIMNFMPVIANPVPNLQPIGQSMEKPFKPTEGGFIPTPFYKPVEEVKDDKFWNDKALKQSLWGYWKDVKKGEEMTIDEMEGVAYMFDKINNFVDKRGEDKTDDLDKLADSVPF